MDVTDMVEYNIGIINRNNLEHSFFQMVKDDPTIGFEFDATAIAGHACPKDFAQGPGPGNAEDELSLQLRLGSHVALYMRHQLEQQKGYTSTVGIATNKVLAKLVGNMNKPKGQTVLMPSNYAEGLESSVMSFMDAHEIGKVPGIGFKLAQRLREFILQRETKYDWTDAGTKEPVTVAQVRQHPDVNYEMLEKLLAGPGSAHGIGYKIWSLLHGVDDSEVSQARAVPRQISIEDSYVRLDTLPELLKELNALARSLINRMRIDLLSNDEDFEESKDESDNDTVKPRTSLVGMKWLAHPRTLRLTTRPRQPLQPDGSRPRTMKRISHSCPLPNFVFLLSESVEILAEKLVRDSLVTMFRKLHPEKSWWNLSLVNLAVTNMAETASDSKSAIGRDIGNMFKRQENVLKDFRVVEEETETTITPEPSSGEDVTAENAVELVAIEADEDEDGWVDEDGMDAATDYCHICDSAIPSFAMVAHQRFHEPAVS